MKKIKVLVGGCFNRIHPGHIYFLDKAKIMGDYLTVILTNDNNNTKPYAIPAAKRKTGLKNLSIADKIIIGDPKDKIKIIRKFQPDIIALGYDQKLTKEQKQVIKEMKISVKRIKKHGEFSSRSR